MKVVCIKSSRNETISLATVYTVYGTIGIQLYSPYPSKKNIYFVVYNDVAKWKAYPSFLFQPHG